MTTYDGCPLGEVVRVLLFHAAVEYNSSSSQKSRNWVARQRPNLEERRQIVASQSKISESEGSMVDVAELPDELQHLVWTEGQGRAGIGVYTDLVHWWDDPTFDIEGDAWRQLQHRKERVARFLSVVRCIPGLKRWASRAGRTCYAPEGSVAQRLVRQWGDSMIC